MLCTCKLRKSVIPLLSQQISNIPSTDLKIFTSRSLLQGFDCFVSLGVDLILKIGTQQTQTLNQLPLVLSNFHETLQGRSAGEYSLGGGTS